MRRLILLLTTFLSSMNHPKIDLIRQAIAKADRHESKLTEGPLSIGGYTGKRIRHLLNNLGDGSTNYLEIGIHRSATFCAANYLNKFETSIGIENFTEFDDGTVKEELQKNCSQYAPNATLIFDDCWKPDHVFTKPIDLYTYDGSHSLEDQRKAITHFLPSMADTFIMCIDDARWDDVRNGTNLGLQDAQSMGISNLFDTMLWTGQDGDGEGYWNGMRILLLHKL